MAIEMSDEEKALRKERMASYDHAMNHHGHYSMDEMARRRKNLPKSPILEEIRLREAAERGQVAPVDSQSVDTGVVDTPVDKPDRAAYKRDWIARDRAVKRAGAEAAKQP